MQRREFIIEMIIFVIIIIIVFGARISDGEDGQ